MAGVATLAVLAVAIDRLAGLNLPLWSGPATRSTTSRSRSAHCQPSTPGCPPTATATIQTNTMNPRHRRAAEDPYPSRSFTIAPGEGRPMPIGTAHHCTVKVENARSDGSYPLLEVTSNRRHRPYWSTCTTRSPKPMSSPKARSPPTSPAVPSPPASGPSSTYPPATPRHRQHRADPGRLPVCLLSRPAIRTRIPALMGVRITLDAARPGDPRQRQQNHRNSSVVVYCNRASGGYLLGRPVARPDAGNPECRELRHDRGRDRVRLRAHGNTGGPS